MATITNRSHLVVRATSHPEPTREFSFGQRKPLGSLCAASRHRSSLPQSTVTKRTFSAGSGASARSSGSGKSRRRRMRAR